MASTRVLECVCVCVFYCYEKIIQEMETFKQIYDLLY